ncbi:ribonuclease [Asanoa sp. NPDC049518]|uniref:ribonuclease n=1 Tax=unclassified Asanoa TaxID=2685164 RepID=UPI00342C51B5
MTTTPEQGRQDEAALERGAVFQDAEGRQTTDPSTAVEHADSEADRNREHLERGEVGPKIPSTDTRDE